MSELISLALAMLLVIGVPLYLWLTRDWSDW